jgi:hypothetical protein
MAKRKSSKAKATAHLQGHQQTAGGFAFDPSPARAGQSSAWGSPWWSLKRPSDVAASRTLNPAMEAARLRPQDPPSVAEMPQLSVNLAPRI